jgi:hypothetical protein
MQDYQTYSAITDYLQKSYAGAMIRYQPNGMSPLFLMSSMLGDGECLSVEHGYMTKTLVFPSMTLTAAVADGVATTFTVASTANVLPGDMFRVESTKEIIRVATVASGTSVTVVRGVGQVTAAAISNSVVLYAIGNAFEQGSQRPTSRLMNPVRVMNNTQIFRNSWQLPGTMAAINTIVGNTLPEESREDCAFFHAADIEKALIFGQKSGQVINGQYLTTLDGIVEVVRRLAPAGNTITAGSTTNFTQLQNMIEAGFNTIVQGGSNERVVFAGGTAVRVINDIGRLNGTYQLMDGQSNFGLQFKTFKTSRGQFKLVEHPILNTNSTWAQMAISVHLPSLKILYLRGRRTRSQEYGLTGTPVDNGIDAVGGTLTSELTLQNVNPAAHVVVYNLTAGAAG